MIDRAAIATSSGGGGVPGHSSGHRDLIATPVFVASVGLLLLNDHVLKAAWPGWVTGKLSDVAGVVMVAVALTALCRRARPAFGATIVAFGMLKTAPVVAVWAAPALGGVTRTDPTDLVALLALGPTWLWVHRRRIVRPDRVGPSTLVRVAAIGCAVVATTATSNDAGARVMFLEGDTIYAPATDGEHWYRSIDGGETWRRTRGAAEGDAYDAQSAAGPVCVADECYSIAADGGVEVTVGGDEPASAPIVADVDPGSALGVVRVGPDGEPRIVVWFANGAATRGANSGWTWVPESEFDDSPQTEWWYAPAMVVIYVTPILLFASVEPARRSARAGGRRSNAVGDMIAFGGGLLLVSALLMTLVAAPLLGRGLIWVTAVGHAVVALPIAASVWADPAARRRRRLPLDQPGPFSRSEVRPPHDPDDGVE
jgi:hypothetical protein